MKIHTFYYNEDNRRLYVEFSTKKDGDRFYRILDLTYDDAEFYSPEIITEIDLVDADDSLVIEIITQYLKENDLPEELIL